MLGFFFTHGIFGGREEGLVLEFVAKFTLPPFYKSEYHLPHPLGVFVAVSAVIVAVVVVVSDLVY